MDFGFELSSLTAIADNIDVYIASLVLVTMYYKIMKKQAI